MKWRHGRSPKDRPGDLYPRARHQGAQRGRQPWVEGPGVAAYVKLALEDAFYPRAEAMVVRG